MQVKFVRFRRVGEVCEQAHKPQRVDFQNIAIDLRNREARACRMREKTLDPQLRRGEALRFRLMVWLRGVIFNS